MVRLAGLWLFGVFALLPSVGQGSVIYTYEGTPFTAFDGESYFSPGDRVTGFVQFRSAPAPGGSLLFEDVEAFELKAGDLVVNKRRDKETWFLFDDAGQVAFWDLVGQREPSGAGDRVLSVGTYRGDVDWAMDYGSVSWVGPGGEWLSSMANSSLPGVWTRQSVPEPAALVLWSMMGWGAIAWSCRRRRA